jgi:hypothetical protein
MDVMKVIGVDAVGTGPNELRYGYAFLKSNIKRTQLPMISTNLIDVKTKKPALDPYIIKKVGHISVGYFSLMTDKADLGKPRDSLQIEDPTTTARRIVPELRKKGAKVVVLLSQLGKVEAEDLVTAVPGIDAVICGRQVPLIQKGRMIKNTIASYGGDQGQFVSRTLLTLDKSGTVTAAENENFQLTPEVGERQDVLKLVKTFEDAFNEKMRIRQKEEAAKQAVVQQANADHYLGAELCGRCHKAEYDQWKTTAHSQAWLTLTEQKKDADPACIGCHVVGYKQNGGFATGADAERLANVQCENCHGMGTKHDAFAKEPKPVAKETCMGCHNADRDPGFDFEKKVLLISHDNTSGETLKMRGKGTPPANMSGSR